MASFKARLSKIGSLWKKGLKREDTFGGSNIPDGSYILKAACEIAESGSGNMQIVWKHTVMEGEHRGETVRDYDRIATEDNIFFLQRKITKLGYEIPDSPEELEGVIDGINDEGIIFRGTVKTRDDFTHVRINKVLDYGEEEPEEGKDTPEGEGEEKEGESEEKGSEEEEVDLSVGMVVSWTHLGKDREGEIVAFTHDDSRARISSNGKRFLVPIEKLEPMDQEPVEEPEEKEEPEEETEAKTTETLRGKREGGARVKKVSR